MIWPYVIGILALLMGGFSTASSAMGLLANLAKRSEREFFEELPHPEVGAKKHAGIPWRLANSPNGVRAPAPLLGADTDAVLSELLGYSVEHIGENTVRFLAGLEGRPLPHCANPEVGPEPRRS